MRWAKLDTPKATHKVAAVPEAVVVAPGSEGVSLMSASPDPPVPTSSRSKVESTWKPRPLVVKAALAVPVRKRTVSLVPRTPLCCSSSCVVIVVEVWLMDGRMVVML